MFVVLCRPLAGGVASFVFRSYLSTSMSFVVYASIVSLWGAFAKWQAANAKCGIRNAE